MREEGAAARGRTSLEQPRAREGGAAVCALCYPPCTWTWDAVKQLPSCITGIVAGHTDRALLDGRCYHFISIILYYFKIASNAGGIELASYLVR